MRKIKLGKSEEKTGINKNSKSKDWSKFYNRKIDDKGNKHR